MADSAAMSLRRGLRRERAVLIAMGVGCLLASQSHANAALAIPDNFDGFTLVQTDFSLNRSFSGGKRRLLIAQGDYLIDNPVVVAGASELMLYGAGRMKTRLLGKHPQKPLLVIRDDARVVLSGVSFVGSTPGAHAPLVDAGGSLRSILLVQDAFFAGGGLRITAPGRFVVQGSHFDGSTGSSGAPDAYGILIDDPGAEVTVIGGNMSHHSRAHVLQRRGHLAMFGTGLQYLDGGEGAADVIVSSGAEAAHVLAGLRSEGTNAKRGSVFVRVEPSRERIDVVLKANNFTSPAYVAPDASSCASGVPANTLVEYHAQGTLWLLGNIGDRNVTHLVSSAGSGATVVALGNAVKGCLDSIDPTHDMFRIEGGRLVAIDNLFDHFNATGDPGYPLRRYAQPDEFFDAQPEIPEIPDEPRNGELDVATRPTFSKLPPGGFLTDATRYRADPACSGAADDTCFLQRALDDTGAALFVPAGTYRISEPLTLNQRGDQIGGLIAGAGSARTRIVCRCASVLQTTGMAYVTVQGISFEAEGAGTTTDAVVSLEWPERVGAGSNPYFATQGNNFYDVRFRGGRYGLAIGAQSLRQCSENLLVDSEFDKNFLGFAAGSGNALSNVLARVRFNDTSWNLGFSDSASGGSWVVLGATARGTREGVLYRASLTPALYHLGLDSDGPRLLDIGWNSNETSIFFEHSRFLSRAPASPYINFNAGQGITFLRSQVAKGNVQLQGSGAASFVHFLESEERTSVDGAIHVCAFPPTGGQSEAGAACLVRIARVHDR